MTSLKQGKEHQPVGLNLDVSRRSGSQELGGLLHNPLGGDQVDDGSWPSGAQLGGGARAPTAPASPSGPPPPYDGCQAPSCPRHGWGDLGGAPPSSHRGRGHTPPRRP
jgi:hypothetical protein